jgi:hypothetical protein
MTLSKGMARMNPQQIQPDVTHYDASWRTVMSASGSARNTVQDIETTHISVPADFQRTNKVQSDFDAASICFVAFMLAISLIALAPLRRRHKL